MESKERRIKPSITVRVARESAFFGPGVQMILEALKATGAMKEACRMTGMSYSKAWRIINEAERQLGYTIVERRHGGQSGGGCIITQEGLDLMQDYQEAEQRIKEYSEQVFAETFSTYENRFGVLQEEKE